MTSLYKEIAEESFTYAYSICKKENREGGVGDHIWVTLSMMKAGELIVDHCLESIRVNTPPLEPDCTEWDRGYDQAMKDCLHHIKEHFGVK